MNQPISSIVGGQRKELADMSWEEYRAFPALNGSVIVEGRRSLRHLHYAWHHGREDTDALQFGRLLHCLLFEPREVESRYRAWEGRRGGKEYKLFCEEAVADGAEVVKSEGEYSMEKALAATGNFFGNARVKELIKAGEAEKTVLCPEADLQCKGRLDWVSTAEHVLTDLKTAAEIEPRLFGASFFRYSYHLKLGLYQRWLQEVTGEKWPCEIILLESKPPHDTAVVEVSNEILEAGAETALRIIEKVAVAIEKDEWPDISGEAKYLPLHVPYYVTAAEGEEEQVEFQG